jgi:hypothetical protein
MRAPTRLLLLSFLGLLPQPAFSQELRAEPSVLYFVTLPFGGESRRDREPVIGFSFQGRQAHQRLRLDSRILHFVEGGVEAKYLLVGAVALGAAALAGSKDRSVEAQRAQAAQRPPCTAHPSC